MNLGQAGPDVSSVGIEFIDENGGGPDAAKKAAAEERMNGN